jgi:hypothetical protein
MAGFANVSRYVQAMKDGHAVQGHYRKMTLTKHLATWWADLSVCTGEPWANVYRGTALKAYAFDRWTGIYHGPRQAPAETWLTHAQIGSTDSGVVMPGLYLLADYLLYYPGIDLDSLELQTLDNTTTIGRFTTGDGVLVIGVYVSNTGVMPAGGTFQFTYVNQAGATVTSPVQTTYPWQCTMGYLATGYVSYPGQLGPFCRLNGSDTGVRRIVSFQNLTVTGGTMALVLVRPLLYLPLREAYAHTEIEMVSSKPGPVPIHDEAHLEMLGYWSSTSNTGQSLYALFNFVWQ